MEEFNPNNSLCAMVHVMVPKNGTLQWECTPNTRFVILLEAAYKDIISAEAYRKSGRVTDEFIECWRTVADVSEYVHRFNMIAAPLKFILDDLVPGVHPAKIDEKIIDELRKYPRESDKLLSSITKGLNSARKCMCNSSAAVIDAEIIDELKHGKKVDSNGKYDGIVQAIVKKAKEIRLGANHNEILPVNDMPIRLYIRGEWLCDRLSINEWNALFSRYENDENSKIIDYLEDTEHGCNYAIIETTLYTVLLKGAVMDLKFLASVKVGDEWKSELLH